MAVLITVAERSVLAFASILFFIQIVSHEIGYQLGRRDHARKENPETVGVIVGGMLGLLAFVLALTLSFANTRFSERRMGSLAETNAIGTAWLRAKAVGTPRAEEIASLLEQYAKVRADFIAAGRTEQAVVEASNQRTNALQSALWGHLAAIVREQPNPVTNALMTALNDTFDASATERFAYETRLPPQLFWLLVGMTMLCMGSLGYQFGLKEKPSRVLIALLTLMWTSVIVDILDLASARLGSIRTETTVYDWTIQSFKGGLTIPPLVTQP
ncbi:bestrophin-like domain [Beijerinckia mobilis]|uniref:bestrophin-like domain n=1 Tax=Beijerinckia mobilis TaxID=231434 RepID=UPI00054D6BE4|nr:hypothetical protein [Beijerinckia mobilis]